MKFTGQFNKLKEHGYEFQKLFGNNYKCYHKSLQGKFHWKVWVWVADGGYIELDDWHDNTNSIMETLKDVDWNKCNPSNISKSVVLLLGQNQGPILCYDIRNYDYINYGGMTEYVAKINNPDVTNNWVLKYPDGYDTKITVLESQYNAFLNELKIINGL